MAAMALCAEARFQTNIPKKGHTSSVAMLAPSVTHGVIVL